MEKKDLKIVYMGTPDFAVEPLRRLCDGGYNVAAVVTMPDKPAGRGHKMQFSPVKTFALERGLPVLQPEKLKSEAFLAQLKDINADLQIVVAFRMLPEVVWNMPRLGTFNLHASLLPQYRGAAPINWAVINGDKETGVSTFFLTKDIDTGRVIGQKRVAIEDTDDAGSVHDKLMMVGSDLTIETVDSIIDGSYTSTEQSDMYVDESDLRPAPKIFKDTCRLDFTKNADDLRNFVRGMSPSPCSWAELKVEGQEPVQMKVYKAESEVVEHSYAVGTLVTDGKKYLKVAVSDGYLSLKCIQIPGKKRLDIEDFLRGYKIQDGAFLE